MEDQQLRIRDDLRDIVTGDILVDDLARAAYSTDASILEVRPAAIVAPRTVTELAEVVRYAAEQGLPLHPRGAGTGLAGEALGPFLVIDTRRYLNRVLEIGSDSVRVEVGLCWAELQRHLARTGRRFAPDPVSGDRCTIGGMLGTDAAGPHALRYGTTRSHVLGLRIVLANGELVEVGREPIAGPGAETNGSSRLKTIVTDVAAVLRESAAAIEREQPASRLKSGGYSLRGVLEHDRLDLPRLLCGSEGTLAVFAEAELATLPLPEHRGILLAFCRSLESASQAVVEALEFQPVACELMDRRLLQLVRETEVRFRSWIPSDAEAMLLFEQQGSSAGNVRDRLRRMAERLGQRRRLASETVAIFAEPELSQSWWMRNLATSLLMRAAGPEQPVPFVENPAVPPERLPEFLKRVQEIMASRGVTACYAAHAGVGILHTRPLLDLRDPEHRALLEALAYRIQKAALDLGGTNNGEHGVGLLRSGLIPYQYPQLYAAFCRIKAAFDPHNQLNPGHIVGAEGGLPLARLRAQFQAGKSEAPLATQLLWPKLSMAEVAERCNGCGGCQTRHPATRMCPTFKVVGSELASPRAKANLMRQILAGALDPRTLASDELRRVADYCVNCKMCRFDCPSAVDISKLMLEAKSANVAEHGLARPDAILAHLEGWARRASACAPVANWLLASRLARWWIERAFGIARRRRLPRFHHRTFLRRAARQGWTQKPRATDPRPKVALLVDLFVNHNDPHLGECLVRVLEHNGRRVYVPPNQRASGMAPLQVGDVETARACLEWNLDIFAELVRDGYDVIAIEPSAALMFRDEARSLVAGADLELLAEHTFEFTEYLAVLLARGELRDDLRPVPLTAAYHEPCHQRALAPRGSTVAVLAQIPSLRVLPLDLGCSGMAGGYGLRADGFEISLAAGAALFERLAQPDIHFGATQCATCRLQMEQGAGKRTLHPAHWLAAAYGLVHRPERLFAPLKQGVLSTS